MSENQETTSDAAEELWDEKYASQYAERVKAAANGVRGAAPSVPGNTAALREALEAFLSDVGAYATDGLETVWCSIKGETIRKALSALAAPDRICDKLASADEEDAPSSCAKPLAAATTDP